ncbi:MAG: Crp/Fnr family transcriptional regulator [Bacteroidetes bacterium]|nr:MAG: Crp/Fnr family transcriptional regulator [Bacteroidota bacterium]
MSGGNLINSYESCSIQWKNFQHLTKSELQLINENRYEATFKPGEIMIKQGSPTSNALFMADGMAKTYIEGRNGKNFIMNIALPGKLIMGPGAYVNSRHTYSVAAITTVHACFINFGIFKQLVRVNGAFAESLLEDISVKSLRSHIRMVNLAQKRMSGRLAEILLYFADEVFNSNEYEMILSRQELGEMSTMAKECVVRILKELEDSGIIYSSTSKIIIRDKERLIQISEKG